MASKKERIRHVGNITALCNPNIEANLREDLPYERYERFGVIERFQDEPEYRICKNCLRELKKPHYKRNKFKRNEVK